MLSRVSGTGTSAKFLKEACKMCGHNFLQEKDFSTRDIAIGVINVFNQRQAYGLLGSVKMYISYGVW